MIPSKYLKGYWLSMMILVLFSHYVHAQSSPDLTRQTNYRISSRHVSPLSPRANRTAVNSGMGEYKNRFQNTSRKASFINSRTSGVLDCGDYSCIQLVQLPVKLIEFYGIRINNGEVELSWTTSEEINNEYFEVERTLNPATGFHVVAKVPGKINSTTNSSYKLTEPNFEEVYTYYRLKQVDQDGSFLYSRIIAVKGFFDPLTVTPAPNPVVSSDFKFLVSGQKAGEKLMVQVSDVTGNLLYQNDEYILGEDKIISFQASGVKVGLYVVKIKNTLQQASKSFLFKK